MRYVKTNDRIIEITDKGCVIEIGGIKYAFKDKKYSHHFQNGYVVVDQADIVDDLLDGYICHKELVKDILVAKSYSKTYNLPIYGCIYVEDEGFIIVAKVVDILPDGEVSWSLKEY